MTFLNELPFPFVYLGFVSDVSLRPYVLKMSDSGRWVKVLSGRSKTSRVLIRVTQNLYVTKGVVKVLPREKSLGTDGLSNLDLHHELTLLK